MESELLNIVLSENSQTKNGLITKKVITITKKNDRKNVSYKEIKKIYDDLIKTINPKDIYIQVMTHRELTI